MSAAWSEGILAHRDKYLTADKENLHRDKYQQLRGKNHLREFFHKQRKAISGWERKMVINGFHINAEIQYNKFKEKWGLRQRQIL